jgi:branched-subunit amino acid transport protein
MTDSTTIWLTILGMGAITFALRFSFIALSGKIDLPPSAKRALEFVPAAVFSALIFPSLLGPALAGQFTSGVAAQNLTAIFAVLVAWRTKNVAITIGAGLVVLWLLMATF